MSKKELLFLFANNRDYNTFLRKICAFFYVQKTKIGHMRETFFG